VQLARDLAPDAARAAGHKGGAHRGVGLLTFEDVAMPASIRSNQRILISRTTYVDTVAAKFPRRPSSPCPFGIVVCAHAIEVGDLEFRNSVERRAESSTT
jgi:hypothetical protein